MVTSAKVESFEALRFIGRIVPDMRLLSIAILPSLARVQHACRARCLVSIKPLHSIVAAVMEGGRAELLL